MTVRSGVPRTLTPQAIGELLVPYLQSPAPLLLQKLAVYLEVLLRWNARMNLTAVRSPEEIVTRHFGESLFAGGRIGNAGSLLDIGSGAGFPGLPIALLHPQLSVTLAESQHKKSAFLREACRVLEVPVRVWADRVEEMAAGEMFDTVCLRAVDRMETALAEASRRARSRVVLLTTQSGLAYAAELDGFSSVEKVPVPESEERVLLVLSR